MRTMAKALTGLAAWACAAWLALPAQAQSPGTWQVRGTLGTTTSLGGSVQISFSCTGMNPCVGTYTALLRDPFCTNSFSVGDSITIEGLNLAQPGPLQGSVTLVNFVFFDTGNPDGSCFIQPGSFGNFFDTFTGSWDGRQASVTLAPIFDDRLEFITLTGSLTATTAAPVFPMAVTVKIDGTIANASAAIQYRAQDLGSSGSVYTFAIAPSTLVANPLATDALRVGYAKSADGRKDTAVACVLAQLTSSGQLQAVSASSLQAYVTGVLSSQGQAVQVINGVATASIGGATFFVGYGSSAAAMLNGGINRSVVSVPGSRECKPSAPQTGWWWNPAEGGRGYSIEVQGNHLFYAAYLYDESGRSAWYVATGNTSLEGSLFTGELLKVTGGQTLFGAYKAPAPAQSLGPFTLAFSDALNGTMVWPGGTVAIERFNIVPNGLSAPAQANVPESGWWWNANESGRGYFIEWQNGSADIAGYMYDDAGNPVWYISVGATPDARTYAGSWWTLAGGQTLTGAYKPATLVDNNVAPLAIHFDSPTTATLTLPGGTQLPITRFRF